VVFCFDRRCCGRSRVWTTKIFLKNLLLFLRKNFSNKSTAWWKGSIVLSSTNNSVFNVALENRSKWRNKQRFMMHVGCSCNTTLLSRSLERKKSSASAFEVYFRRVLFITSRDSTISVQVDLHRYLQQAFQRLSRLRAVFWSNPCEVKCLLNGLQSAMYCVLREKACVNVKRNLLRDTIRKKLMPAGAIFSSLSVKQCRVAALPDACKIHGGLRTRLCCALVSGCRVYHRSLHPSNPSRKQSKLQCARRHSLTGVLRCAGLLVGFLEDSVILLLQNAAEYPTAVLCWVWQKASSALHSNQALVSTNVDFVNTGNNSLDTSRVAGSKQTCLFLLLIKTYGGVHQTLSLSHCHVHWCHLGLRVFHSKLGFFFRWDILVIFPITVLKLTITVFTKSIFSDIMTE